MRYDPEDPKITAYVFGELEADERAELEAAMAEDDALRSAVEQTRETLTALQTELTAESTPSLSGEQRDVVEQAIAAAPAKPSPAANAPTKELPRTGRGAQFWATVAAIEAVTIALGALLFFPAMFGPQGSTAMAPPANPEPASAFSEQAMGGDAGDAERSSKVATAPPAETATRTQPVDEMKVADSSSAVSNGSETVKVADGSTVAAMPLATTPEPTPNVKYSAQPSGAPANSTVAKTVRLHAAPGQSGGSMGMGAPASGNGVAFGGAGAGSGAGMAGGGGGGLASGGLGGGGLGGMPAPGGAAGYGLAPGNAGAMPGGAPGPTNSPTKGFYEQTAGKNKRRASKDLYVLESTRSKELKKLSQVQDKLSTTTLASGLTLGTEPTLGDDGLDAFGDQGRGPGWGGDRHEPIVENDFLSPWNSPYSTFSIDVDTAAYSKVRMHLMQMNQLPRRDAVRIEELINYFPYSYEPPSSEENAAPFAARMTVSECPWRPEHRLVRVGIKGKDIDRAQRPASNLVFLLDVSGSMNRANKLPLLVEGMKMLTSQLGENDTVSIVVYAGAAGMVLEPTNGDEKNTILDSLERLRAGGSTNGGAGIKLAYQTALDNFIKGGVNRVILCTDGDFNVGVTGTDELVRVAETNAKDGVFLTVLGFGMGNHNDSMLEKLSNKGNGNYAFIDTQSEARKVLVEQMSSTLVTIAKDVKIQVEFNPELVASYRLIGYENRILAAEDFNDDTKDAGEIGAGHAVTAIYEVVPAEAEDQPELPEVDSLKYQRPPKLTKEAKNDELLTVKIRYKKPDEDKSVKLEFPLDNKVVKFGEADVDFRFTAAVASFGMLLRQSKYRGDASFDAVLEIATEASQHDQVGYRTEFLEMVKRAKALSGN